MVRVNEQSDEHSLNVCAVLGKRARSMVPTAASDDAQGDPQPQLRGIVFSRQPPKVELGFVEKNQDVHTCIPSQRWFLGFLAQMAALSEENL